MGHAAVPAKRTERLVRYVLSRFNCWRRLCTEHHTGFVRAVVTVAVVVIDPVEGNGARTVQAGERFALVVELTFCRSREKKIQVAHICKEA